MKKTILAFCLIPIASVFLDNAAMSATSRGSVYASVVKTDVQQTLWRKLKASKSQTPLLEIRQVNELQRTITNAFPLLVQQSLTAEVVEVTGVKVNQTKTGIEVILETPQSSALKPEIKIEGNKLTADIPNAQLRLPSGDTFRQSKPVTGITEVTVTNINQKSIQLTVTGETSVPQVELFDSSNQGLVFGVSATTATAQQPTQQQQTTPETKPTLPSTQKQPPIELEVTASPDTNYRVNRATVTKTDIPLIEIPRSVQVFPRQVIEDLGARNIQSVLQTIGVRPSSPAFSSRLFDNFRFRGFVNTTNLRNGLRDPNSGYAVDPSNTERIEVIRGPASVLYGQLSPGGIVNRVTKQPLFEPYYFAQMQIGSYDFYQPAIDFSSPLNAERTLSYRLNASYLSSNSFVDFVNQQRYFVAPAVSWQIDKNTSLTVDGEYQNVEKPNGDAELTGIPADGTILPNPNGKIPRDRNLGDPFTDNESRTVYRIGYNLEHRFEKNWVLHNAFQFTQNHFIENLATVLTALQPDNRTVNSLGVYNDGLINTYFTDTNITGKFKTGSIEHNLLVGFDLLWQSFSSPQILYARRPIDAFNPVYSGLPGTVINRRPILLNENDAQGLYAQDQISLTDNLKLLLGGRFDWFYLSSKVPSSQVNISQPDRAFSPQLGIVYLPSKNVSLYASYSRSFEQVTGNDAGNNPFKPSRGTQYEVGVKTDFLNNKLSTTLALYDLTKTNITTTDPNNSAFNVQTGEQRSRGIELFAIGELASGWNIIASYNYIDGRVTKDNNTSLVGNFFDNVPEHSASLWTTYIVPSGAWKGFGGGLGVYYVGDRYGDLANTLELPSYVRTDAALYYRRNNLKVQLNLQNLFNLLYYESVISRARVVPGAPFEAQLTVGWEF